MLNVCFFPLKCYSYSKIKNKVKVLGELSVKEFVRGVSVTFQCSRPLMIRRRQMFVNMQLVSESAVCLSGDR